MEQKFYRYELWEDWQNGMYINRNDDQKEVRIEQAVYLFKDKETLLEEMRFVAFNWTHSAQVQFTNPATNHQAWLGQASCCHYCGCGEMETIEAWHRLTKEERDIANGIADDVFCEWMTEYEKQQPFYQERLF